MRVRNLFLLAALMLVLTLFGVGCGTTSPDTAGIPSVTVTGFSPAAGTVGTPITITGSGFSATSVVKFGGVTATILPAPAPTANSLTVTVPVGAVSGQITVGNAGSPNFFTVIPTGGGGGGGTAPAAPTGVTAIVTSATAIDIDWTLVAGAVSYNIYRSTIPGVAIITANKINTTPIPAGPFGNTGLTTGTKYYYVVTSVNAAAQESVASLEVSATPAPIVAPPPSNVTATIATATSLNLTWSPVPGATGYDIYSATTTKGMFLPGTNTLDGTKKIATVLPATPSYTHIGRTTGQIYYYVVVTTTLAGNSLPSQEVSAIPGLTIPPLIVSARYVNGVSQTILQNNVEVSILDNTLTPITNANVTLNTANLIYDSVKGFYRGFVPSAAGSGITLNITVAGITYSNVTNLLPPAATPPTPTPINVPTPQFAVWPTLNHIDNGVYSVVLPSASLPAFSLNPIDPVFKVPLPPLINLGWTAAGLVTGENLGMIVFDTVSVVPYWEKFAYWNNYISPNQIGSAIPTAALQANKNYAIILYESKTVPIYTTSPVGTTAVNVGHLDLIMADPANTTITVTTIP